LIKQQKLNFAHISNCCVPFNYGLRRNHSLILARDVLQRLVKEFDDPSGASKLKPKRFRRFDSAEMLTQIIERYVQFYNQHIRRKLSATLSPFKHSKVAQKTS